MKKLLIIIPVAAWMIIYFSECTKEGPQGPPGSGGENGKDANATCTQCHNLSDSLIAKIFQYDASKHAAGSTSVNTQQNCAPCHTSQGFIEVLKSGLDTTAQEISDPAPINCRTCHLIHTSYTVADYALRTTSSFMNKIDSTTNMTTDLGDATGNLCARCHQVIKANPWLDKPTSITDSLNITDPYWGPHHGPQSMILGGNGAFEIGNVAFRNSYHKGKTSCIICHSAKAVGNFTGGHSLRLVNEQIGNNFFGCNTPGCHEGLNDFDYKGMQTEIENKLIELEEKLEAAGMLNVTTGLLNTGTYPQKQLAVWWNYLLIREDGSLGVHNTNYALDMTQAGIDYFSSQGF